MKIVCSCGNEVEIKKLDDKPAYDGYYDCQLDESKFTVWTNYEYYMFFTCQKCKEKVCFN